MKTLFRNLILTNLEFYQDLHLIFLNIGEQIRTSETGDELGTFTSYMTAFSLSYSALISPKKSFGIEGLLAAQ